MWKKKGINPCTDSKNTEIIFFTEKKKKVLNRKCFLLLSFLNVTVFLTTDHSEEGTETKRNKVLKVSR